MTYSVHKTTKIDYREGIRSTNNSNDSGLSPCWVVTDNPEWLTYSSALAAFSRKRDAIRFANWANLFPEKLVGDYVEGYMLDTGDYYIKEV